MQVRRVLISVSDKGGLEPFVKGLKKFGVTMISTGGTARFIRDLGIEVTDISKVTGFPEMLDGRVKTLHPKIHGGLLALRDNKDHMKQAKDQGIEPIDMVVVNLYPFARTVAKKGCTFEDAIENIDIGGPSMLRSAAKNFRYVAVVPDPSYYAEVLEEMKENGASLGEETLKRLATATFKKTAEYDRMICDYFAGTASCEDVYPDKYAISLEKVTDLRYGENPHQKAAFYKTAKNAAGTVASAKQLHGKELSFNNIMDLDAALDIIKGFKDPAAVIIKHTNPCGAATAATLKQAYADALACDPMSAFGSIVGLNGPVDRDAAEEIAGAGFVECIIAPSFNDEAMEILTQKKNVRLLEFGDVSADTCKCPDIKRVSGGMLVQERDIAVIDNADIKVVTKKRPSQDELDSLLFGWEMVKHVKSNAIVLCRGRRTVGIGAGQMSRVDSVIVAVRKAGEKAKGSTLASDAFFPKPDGVETAAEAGVTAIIQPGGSKADEEIIKAADAAGLIMVFTGKRHFKH